MGLEKRGKTVNKEIEKKELEVRCKLCNSLKKVVCESTDYKDWKKGKGLIQDVMSYLSADERELLISGICGDCFDSLREENE